MIIQVSKTIHYSAATARWIAGRFIANEIAYLFQEMKVNAEEKATLAL